jgi:hypothetical protein
MSNSDALYDHSFGAIEAAIRETVRGRAFLEDFAKRVRQSDTLTVLAMIARLERWCQEQAIRLTEIERRGVTFESQTTEGGSSLSLIGCDEAFVPMVDRTSTVFFANGSDMLPGTSGLSGTSSDSATNIASVEMAAACSLEPTERIEFLSNTLSDLDTRVNELRRVSDSFSNSNFAASDICNSIVVGAVDDDTAMTCASNTTEEKIQRPLENELLDEIAKALGLAEQNVRDV